VSRKERQRISDKLDAEPWSPRLSQPELYGNQEMPARVFHNWKNVENERRGHAELKGPGCTQGFPSLEEVIERRKEERATSGFYYDPHDGYDRVANFRPSGTLRLAYQ